MSVNWGMAGAVRPDPYGAYLDARNNREQRQEHQEDRQQQRDARNTNRALAQAMSARDVAAVRKIAGGSGDPELVQQAETYVRRHVWDNARRFNAELGQVVGITDPNQRRAAYARWYGEVQREVERMGGVDPSAMERFHQIYPAPGQETDESLAAAYQDSSNTLRTSAEQFVGPEDWYTAQNHAGTDRRYAAAGNTIVDTYTGKVRPNPYYVRGGGAAGDVDPASLLPPGSVLD